MITIHVAKVTFLQASRPVSCFHAKAHLFSYFIVAQYIHVIKSPISRQSSLGVISLCPWMWFSFPICWIWSYFCLLDFHHSLMSGVFSSLRRREEGGGVWVPFLNGGWRLSLIFVTVPIYLGKREALQSEVRKNIVPFFSPLADVLLNASLMLGVILRKVAMVIRSAKESSMRSWKWTNQLM